MSCKNLGLLERNCLTDTSPKKNLSCIFTINDGYLSLETILYGTTRITTILADVMLIYTKKKK